MELPLVTIAIPTFNRAGMLAVALKSALGQTYSQVEVIVSDNASTDETRGFLEGYRGRIRVLRQKQNIGMCANWEACLSAASGMYFLLISDDDYLEPGAVEALLKGYSGENTAFVYGRTMFHCLDGAHVPHKLVPPGEERCREYVMACFQNRRYAPSGATLFRRSDAVKDGGYFYGNFNLVMDSAMMYKVAAMNPDRVVRSVPLVVFNYRLHAANATNFESIGTWVSEIRRLLDMVSSRISSSPAELADFRMNSDLYISTFIVNSAGHAMTGNFIKRLGAFCAHARLSLPYLRPPGIGVFAHAIAFSLLSKLPDGVKRRLKKIAGRA